MKKILYSSLIVLLLCATGCSKEKVLNCTLNDDSGKIEIISKFETRKNGTIYKNSEFLFKTNIASFSEEQIESLNNQDFCSIFKNMYQDGFNNCNTKTEKEEFIVSADLDLYKAAGSNISLNLDDTKNQLESAGYTCSVK